MLPSPPRRSRPLRASAAATALVVAGWLAAIAPAAAQDYPVEPFPEPKAAPAPKLTKPPQVVKPVEPVYPPEALAAGLSADVTVTIDLDAEGKVTKAEVAKPVGNGFDEAAVAAIQATTFSPAEIDNKPSAIRFTYTLHFVPRVVPATPPAPPPEAAPEPPPPPPPPPNPVVAVGRVRERGTRNPLPGADVAVSVRTPDGGIESARVAASTDSDGRFELRAPPGVALRIIIAEAAHEPCIRDLDAGIVSGDKPADIDCLVARRGGPSYEARVSAPRETQSVTRYTLTAPELTTVPGTFGDPLRVVQNLPGVARSPFGLGLLIIRGANPQDSGIFVEGHQIPIVYHFLGGPSVLTPRLIDRVDFFPGNFGVQYGRFSGGIVDVGLKSEDTPRLHGLADINLIDSSAYVEGPLGGGWTGSVAARRSYIDLVLAAVLPSSSATVAPAYYDYQAGARHAFAGGKIALYAIGSDDTLKVVSTDPQANLSLNTETGFHRLFAVWTRALGKWNNNLSPALGYDRLVFSAGAVSLDESAYTAELRDELTRVFSPRLTLRVGFDGQLRRDAANFNIPIPPETRLYGPSSPMFQHGTFPLDRLGTALFTDATWDVGPGVRLIPGLRVDYFRYVGQDRFTFDPRLVARWKTSPVQTLKMGVGLFHQMVSPTVLNPQYGNPTLPPILATQYSVGLERRLAQRLTIDATAYLVYRYDEPVPVAGPAVFEPTGQQRSYGLELILKHEFTERFYGWIAYTLSRSEEHGTAVGGASTAGDGTVETMPAAWTPTAFDQTHNFILVASYKLQAWRLGTRFRVVTGSPTTLLQEGYYDTDRNQYTCGQSVTNGAREPTFNQLDVRVERTWTFDAWMFSAYLDVQNVYNALNPEATIYDYRCRDAQPIRGVPVLPVLGLRGLF